MIRACSAAAAMLLTLSCTESDLYMPFDPDSERLRLHLEAAICAPDPVVEEVPYKILLVIDVSYSNTWNDVNDSRFTAYMDAINSHIGKENVEFGVVTFNDYAHRPTLVFTRDYDILTAVGENVKTANAGGGTNYEDTIATVYDFIIRDINFVSNAVESQRTHYQVYWLSDGLPRFGITDRYTLVANVRTMREYLAPSVAEFELSTLYLDSTGVWEEQWEIDAARQLLEDMAVAGGGTFSGINSSEGYAFDIDPTPQIRRFTFADVIASNKHTRLAADVPIADSDGDGISDDDEAALQLDPTNPDTDQDGYRDGVEVMASVRFDPLLFDEGCDNSAWDQDGDGLRDCEELALGTRVDVPDTDRDNIPDGIEILLGSSALSDDPTTDKDLDGSADSTEVRMHLDPNLPDTDEEEARWAYRYNLVSEEVASGDPPCYTVTVENLSMSETLATEAHPAGGQVIEIMIAFETTDSVGLSRHYSAQRGAGYRWPDFRQPADGNILLGPADFHALGPIEEADLDGDGVRDPMPNWIIESPKQTGGPELVPPANTGLSPLNTGDCGAACEAAALENSGAATPETEDPANASASGSDAELVGQPYCNGGGGSSGATALLISLVVFVRRRRRLAWRR